MCGCADHSLTGDYYGYFGINHVENLLGMEDTPEQPSIAKKYQISIRNASPSMIICRH